MPLPHLDISGRSLSIVLLGWFLTLITANEIAAVITHVEPKLEVICLTVSYGLHALLGTSYICLAEGIALSHLFKLMFSDRHVSSAKVGVSFFSVIFIVMFVMGFIVSLLPCYYRSVQDVFAESSPILILRKSFWVNILFFLW